MYQHLNINNELNIIKLDKHRMFMFHMRFEFVSSCEDSTTNAAGNG